MPVQYIVHGPIERGSIRIEFREPLDRGDVSDVNDRRIYIVEIDLVTGKEKSVAGLGVTYATVEGAQAAYEARTSPQVVLSPAPQRQ